MSTSTPKDVLVDIDMGIGTITLNRPRQANSFGGSLLTQLLSALRQLNDHPNTVFTVITGSGRFFSAGADLTSSKIPATLPTDPGERKMLFSSMLVPNLEVNHALITHRKVLVLAMNGPAVGGGAWFPGACDIMYAAKDAYIQIPFSELGLVPEFGMATTYADHLGVHRANEMLMFGERVGVEELRQVGLVNEIFEKEGFLESVKVKLSELLAERDGKSMMESKRLMNERLKDQRLLAVYESWQALSERFVEGAPMARLAAKGVKLSGKSKSSKM